MNIESENYLHSTKNQDFSFLIINHFFNRTEATYSLYYFCFFLTTQIFTQVRIKYFIVIKFVSLYQMSALRCNGMR